MVYISGIQVAFQLIHSINESNSIRKNFIIQVLKDIEMF